MKHLGIFINDTNSKIKYNVNINNIDKLKHNFDNIIIFDNKSEYAYILNNYIKDDNLIYKYLLSNSTKDNTINNSINNTINNSINNNDLNMDKLNYILSDIHAQSYEYITVINDNYIYIDSLKDYFDYVKNHNMDFYSYTDSTENFYHYQLYLITFKSSYTNKIINNLNNFTSIFKNKISYLKIGYLDNNYEQNIFYNDKLYKYLIENNIIKVIYLNKLNHFIDNYKSDILTEIPNDFDIDIYKNHNDLKNFPYSVLTDHFLNNGQFEARNYKKEHYILPHYIRNGLLKCNDLINLFDIPNDFDLYGYKDKNKDLFNLNRDEILVHYIKFGRNEERNY